MKKGLLIVFLCILLFHSYGQENQIIVLGDLHYDLIDDHDMEWLSRKPDDLRQVTQEYTIYTEKFWDDFMKRIKKRANLKNPATKAILQLGDLSEGLAGNEDKARQMASNTMKAIDATNMPAPWILVKGNHDITGPGGKEAFQEFYIPMIRKQTNNPEIKNASYSYSFDDVQITCVDPWDTDTDLVAFLGNELSKSNAKFKFVAIHEPVIPVTERVWHTLRRVPDKREQLLEVIAKHKAIVLCGHLHRYSVVRRNTSYGPIAQVMVISVVRDKNYKTPSHLITEYGPSIAINKPEWQPETLDARKAVLEEESRYVDFYKQTDLPGYAIIKTNSNKGTILLEYYAAFGNKPYDKIDLSELLYN